MPLHYIITCRVPFGGIGYNCITNRTCARLIVADTRLNSMVIPPWLSSFAESYIPIWCAEYFFQFFFLNVNCKKVECCMLLNRFADCSRMLCCTLRKCITEHKNILVTSDMPFPCIYLLSRMVPLIGLYMRLLNTYNTYIWSARNIMHRMEVWIFSE